VSFFEVGRFEEQKMSMFILKPATSVYFPCTSSSHIQQIKC